MVPRGARANLSERTQSPVGDVLRHTQFREQAMRTIRIGASVLLLAAAVGCGNTADGVKQDTTNAVESTAKAAEATTDAMGAALETASVKAAIIADPRVGASDINVNTDEPTKTVTLNGTVKTAEQKRVAGEVAETKATGYRIVNNLVIRSTP